MHGRAPGVSASPRRSPQRRKCGKRQQREAETLKGGKKNPQRLCVAWRGGRSASRSTPRVTSLLEARGPPRFPVPSCSAALCEPQAPSRSVAPSRRSRSCPPLPWPRWLLPLTASSRGTYVIAGAGLPALRAGRSGDPGRSLELEGGLSAGDRRQGRIPVKAGPARRSGGFLRRCCRPLTSLESRARGPRWAVLHLHRLFTLSCDPASRVWDWIPSPQCLGGKS